MKDLREMSSKELKELSKELHVSNWWNLKKSVMIEEIEKRMTPPEPEKPTKKKTNLKLSELTYKGETKSIREWAAELEMPWPTLYDRVNRNGWSVEEAIEIPLGGRRKK